MARSRPGSPADGSGRQDGKSRPLSTLPPACGGEAGRGTSRITHGSAEAARSAMCT